MIKSWVDFKNSRNFRSLATEVSIYVLYIIFIKHDRFIIFFDVFLLIIAFGHQCVSQKRQASANSKKQEWRGLRSPRCPRYPLSSFILTLATSFTLTILFLSTNKNKVYPLSFPF
jgi:hypothetical protein